MNFSHRKLKWITALMMTVTLAGCSPNIGANNAAKDAQKENATVKSRSPQVERAANNKNAPAEKNPNRKQISDTRQPQVNQRAPRVDTGQNKKMSPKELSTYIAQVVNRVPGVERSYVLVSGNTALVGVDLKADIGGSRIDSIKYSVKEAAEKSTPTGMRAIVSADVDTVTRIRELVAGTRQGKPISSLGDEIADIISRLLPEV
jgi:YhcN/YlaJ family sporulation lipoprotein